jgi:polysaccharide deacetylase 2 family uncharacterized protein YibQ
MIKKPPPRKGREPWPAFNLITALLAAIALFSVVTLDFINFRKGDRSYLFRHREKPPAAVEEAKAPLEPAVKPEAAPVEAEPKPKAEAKREPARKEPPRKPIRGQVALIIDDMGNSLEALDDLLGVSGSLTISVLPYSAHAGQTARIAHENNLEVLLHLPLESLNNHEAMTDTEGMITAGMNAGEITQAFEDSLARVPFASGVNNHMGSRFTADESLMRTLLAPLKDKGLFFVDSRTTAQTVAYGEALRMGIPAVERDVFLDADSDRGRIKSRLIELFRLARKKGQAVGICHPYPETLQALKTNFRLFEDYGLEVVPVSRLLRR